MSLATLGLKTLFNGLQVSGLAAALAPLTAGQGAIFMLHRVRPARQRAFAPLADTEITPEFLGRLVDRVRERGYDVVTLDEALRRLRQSDKRRFVVLTFDDGYRDTLDTALPVLRRREAPFTVFVASGMIDRAMVPWWLMLERLVAQEPEICIRGPEEIELFSRSPRQKYDTFSRMTAWMIAIDEDRQRREISEIGERYGVDPVSILEEEMLDWDGLRQLAADPLVTIGSHTIGHYALAKLPAERVRQEVLGDIDRLEAELGERPRHFAYPYGYEAAADAREFAILRELGVASAVHAQPGTLDADNAAAPTALPRIALNGHLQETRYVDVLLSGAPYAWHALSERLRGGSGGGGLSAYASS